MRSVSNLKQGVLCWSWLVLLLSGCTQTTENDIDYLGQQPPGMMATRFAPGIVSTSTNEHSAPAFSPDGTVMIWGVMDSTYHGYLYEIKYKNGTWSKPERPSFADTTADDYYPSFSPDGSKLFFSSRRKMPAGYPAIGDMRIWEVKRTLTGWGKPVPFDTTVSQGSEYAHSHANNGTVYFSSKLAGTNSLHIQKAEKIKGLFVKPGWLPYSINSVRYEDGPYIAPDERFLIFESHRPEGIGGSLDLYISFRQDDGSFGVPVNMGPKVNSASAERFARLSPDGKYLFFGSGRDPLPGSIGFDIYWIDAKVIDEIKKTQEGNHSIKQPLGDHLLASLYKNDVQASADALQQWQLIYPDQPDASVLYSSFLRKMKRYPEAEKFLAGTVLSKKNNTGLLIETVLVKFAMGKDPEAMGLLDSVNLAGEALREKYSYLGKTLFDMRLFINSSLFYEKALAIRADGDYYKLGSAYALSGNKDKAFNALDMAADLGYKDRQKYSGDPDLVSLQTDPRWKILLRKLK